MGSLRYSINVTVDGCVDHTAFPADEDVHRHATEALAGADALLFGRVTYELMEFWRTPPPEGWPAWMQPFADTINPARKYLVSSTRDQVEWNTELVHGDLGPAVQQLKDSHEELYTGGVQLPLALTELGLIDEYTFMVVPRIAGHGPTLFAGLSRYVDLALVERREFDSGAVALTYRPAG